MSPRIRTGNCLLLAALLTAGWPAGGEAKSYSSGGGRSYSSSSHSSSSGGSRTAGSSSSRSSSGGSSRPSSSGGSASKSSGSSSRSSSPGSGSSKSVSSSSGKSYSTGSTWSDDNRKGYSSAKSYSSGLTFDKAAARARKEQASQQEFTRFKESSRPKSATTEAASPPAAAPSYRVTPPPLTPSASGSYRRAVYVPDAPTLLSRPTRTHTIFYPYVSRPVVVYRDPYNSFFWWWLLDRSLDDRARWAYHHRYDMDPARYQSLVAENQQLEERVSQLEAQQTPRDPNYVPPGLDRDLMYSDRHVTQAYSNRPTPSGKIAFWVLAVPLALGACGFLTWLIFLKRWQPST